MIYFYWRCFTTQIFCYSYCSCWLVPYCFKNNSRIFFFFINVTFYLFHCIVKMSLGSFLSFSILFELIDIACLWNTTNFSIVWGNKCCTSVMFSLGVSMAIGGVGLYPLLFEIVQQMQQLSPNYYILTFTLKTGGVGLYQNLDTTIYIYIRVSFSL